LSSPSSCFSRSPPNVSWAAASVALGWRIRGVDIAAETIDIPPGTDKNGSRAFEIDRKELR
jgi:hypothetical protein